MVVVLCDDYRDAEAAFRAWVAFLLSPPSDEIAKIDKHSLKVETSDGLCYVFVDYRFKNVFLKKQGLMFESVRDFLEWHNIDDPDLDRREYYRKVNDYE